MRLILITFFCFVLFQSYSQNQLEIGMIGGSVLYPERIEYKNPLFKKPHLLVNNEDEIQFSSITYYQTETDYYVMATVGKGFRVFDNARLKRVLTGAIEVYEHKYTVSTTTGGGMNTAPMMSTREVTDYYHYTKKNMELINDKVLIKLVENDPKSNKKLKKIKNKKLINAGIYAVGGTLILSGSINWLKDSSTDMEDTSLNLPPTIIVGAIICWIPWLINKTSEKEIGVVSIIADYNTRH